MGFLFIFNLIFRLGHNIFLSFLSPRGRVYLSMTSMMCSMLILAIVVLLESNRISWVMFAYALGGVAIGSFESTFLNCLTPLGPRTKHVAIIAIPAGIASVSVGGFLLMAPPWNVPAISIYIAVAFVILCGMVVLCIRIPGRVAFSTSSVERTGLRQFASDVRKSGRWLPSFWHYPVAYSIDMFTLAAFAPGAMLYVYNQRTVAITADLTVSTHCFFALVNSISMLGGTTGRAISYRLRPRHPLVYSLLNVAGVALIMLWVPMLAPVGAFLVQLGDGIVYGTITRHIDACTPKEFNLIVLSFWLFIGDFGSVMGANLIYFIRESVVVT